MKIHPLRIWDDLRSSFWFLPTLMVAGAGGLAALTIGWDESVTAEQLARWDWIVTRSPRGASAILGAIGGSMMTIAGVVFSLTLVAMTLASSQFGPRLLRNFMRDTINQVVIGLFVSTFLYALLVLRSIRRDEESDFVPHLSVSVAVLLALASVVVLIYFIHHVAVSIQANEVVGRVHRELIGGIDRLFPERIGAAAPPAAVELPQGFEREARAVAATGDGYLQIVDSDALMRRAVERDLVLRLERRPGHYVVEGTALARAWPRERVDDRLAGQLAEAFVLGTHRTPAQDVEFSIHQLVEVALRALSPSMNDAFTAIACVDRLSSALCRLADRAIPSPGRRDDRGRLRVVASPVTFPDVLDAALHQIRQAARSDAAVSLRLLEALVPVARAATRREDRDALRRHVELIARGARESLPEQEDRQALEERYRRARTALAAAGEP